MRRIVVIAILGLGFLAAPLFGQDALAGRIFDINLGFVGGYRLSDNSPVGGQRFSFDFIVAENVRAGMALTRIAATAAPEDYATFLFNFRFRKLGMVLHVGRQAANMAAGAGFSYALLESVSHGVVHSGLRVGVDYLFNNGAAGGPERGSILLALTGSFGI